MPLPKSPRANAPERTCPEPVAAATGTKISRMVATIKARREATKWPELKAWALDRGLFLELKRGDGFISVTLPTRSKKRKVLEPKAPQMRIWK